MGWEIRCTDSNCGEVTWVENIVDLLNCYRDPRGWFVCPCGQPGYIEKSFELQESGEVWEPYLRGACTLGEPEETYQPFAFLVSDAPAGSVDNVWVSYYKDLRASGGRLKLGYGPGGPPVLGRVELLALLRHLLASGCLTREELASLVE